MGSKRRRHPPLVRQDVTACLQHTASQGSTATPPTSPRLRRRHPPVGQVHDAPRCERGAEGVQQHLWRGAEGQDMGGAFVH